LAAQLKEKVSMNKLDINRILRQNPRPLQRGGAPLGASDQYDGHIVLRLQRVRFVDGGYAPDGTYWGGGTSTPYLWCAFNPDTATAPAAMGTRLYVRAWSRDEAKQIILKNYVNTRFVR
jgi:hypothetical protein